MQIESAYFRSVPRWDEMAAWLAYFANKLSTSAPCWPSQVQVVGSFSPFAMKRYAVRVIS